MGFDFAPRVGFEVFSLLIFFGGRNREREGERENREREIRGLRRTGFGKGLCVGFL